MNFVIGLNVVWVFTESVIDLNDWQEIPLPSMWLVWNRQTTSMLSGGASIYVCWLVLLLCLCFGGRLFSIPTWPFPSFYTLDDSIPRLSTWVALWQAFLKLCHWSFAEYWYHGDNRYQRYGVHRRLSKSILSILVCLCLAVLPCFCRFDFIASMVLGSVAAWAFGLLAALWKDKLLRKYSNTWGWCAIPCASACLGERSTKCKCADVSDICQAERLTVFVPWNHCVPRTQTLLETKNQWREVLPLTIQIEKTCPWLSGFVWYGCWKLCSTWSSTREHVSLRLGPNFKTAWRGCFRASSFPSA